ncbi:MAG: hypothetical protein GX649_12755, partial [Chloroflexi bacterium]|nr:hypothetical protein [Chloroflexota bacterium]
EEHLGACAARAADVVGHCEAAEEALVAEAFDRAADEVAAVVRIDPDNTSPARQAERLRRLEPVFQRIHQFDGWNERAWAKLEQQVLAEVESAFTSLPGSSLKTRVLELAGEVIAQQAAEREEEHLAEGLRLLEEGDWYAAREWAVGVRRRHADWQPAAYVAGLAEAYAVLFDPDDPLLAHERAQDALQDLDAPPPQHEALREHKKRLEVMAECSQHLVSPDEEQQVLAQVVAQNLPEDDDYRAGLLRGIALTRELRMAVRGGHWAEALAAANGLHETRMPVISALAGAWRSLLEQLTEAERLRDEGHYPQALGSLENALRALPAVELGRPAPTIEAVRQGIGGAREMLAEEWAAQQAQAVEAEEEPPEDEAPDPSPEAADGLVRRAGARAIRAADGLRRKGLPSGREALRGAGGWLRDAASRLNATLEGRPATARRRYPSAPPVTPRRRAPAPPPPEEAEEAEPPRRAVAVDDPALRHATRQLDGMRWAIGGAAIVGVLALALALALVRDGDTGNRLGLSGGTAARAAIARIEGLLEGGDDAAAQAALGELWAQQATSMTEEERRAAEALDDCVWLRTQGAAVIAEDLRADLERLPILWERAQVADREADAEGFACPLEGGMAAAVTAAAEARRAALEASLAQDAPAAYEALLGALDGLDLAVLGAPLDDASAFARLAGGAQAGLARHRLAEGDCEGAAAAIAEARALLAGAPQGAETAEIEALAAAQASCAGTRDLCGTLGGLATSPPDHPGDDLVLLAGAAADREALTTACPELAYDDLVAGRLAALGTLAQEGDWAKAVEEGLKLAGHAWFGEPPVEGQASPAEVVADSYAALLETACPAGVCDEAADAWLPEAEAFYGAHRDVLSPAGLVGLVGALRGADSECAGCGLAAAAPVSTTTVSLVDPALGEWSDHGMYFSHTGTGLAWHLNDVFIREQTEAAAVYPAEAAENAYDLYTTAFEPLEEPPGGVVSIRVRGSMISAQGAGTAERPLWGVQVPGSDENPAFVLLVWGPATEAEAGRWALHLWSPLDGDRQVVPLPDGRLDEPVELAIVRGLDGETFDITWRGDLVIAGQPLPAPAGEARVVLVIGEGAHAWIREAEAEVVH